MEPVKLLLVEDDPDVADLVRLYLPQVGDRPVELRWAPTYADGLQAIRHGDEHVCLLDQHLGDGTGLDLLREARAGGYQGAIIFLTASGNRETDLQAMRGGATDYLVKSRLEPDALERAVRYALERAEALEALRRSEGHLRAILDRLGLGTALVDETGRVAFLSRVASDVFGVRGRSDAPWPRALGLDADDEGRVRAIFDHPGRRRVPLRVERAGRVFQVEVEVQQDPALPARKILVFHDVTEIHDLRRLLDERAQFHRLVGRAGNMAEVFRLARDLAAVDATVLIEGETGTGKELVARAHPRRQRSRATGRSSP